LLTGLALTQPDTGQLLVGEQAERRLPPGRHPVPTREIGQYDAEVVFADMSDVRATGAVAHRPDSLGHRLEPLVDLDVPFLVCLDPGFFQTDAVGILRAPPGDEQVRLLDRAAPLTRRTDSPNRPSTSCLSVVFLWFDASDAREGPRGHATTDGTPEEWWRTGYGL
jgi:hypothetical protein